MRIRHEGNDGKRSCVQTPSNSSSQEISSSLFMWPISLSIFLSLSLPFSTAPYRSISRGLVHSLYPSHSPRYHMKVKALHFLQALSIYCYCTDLSTSSFSHSITLNQNPIYCQYPESNLNTVSKPIYWSLESIVLSQISISYPYLTYQSLYGRCW